MCAPQPPRHMSEQQQQQPAALDNDLVGAVEKLLEEWRAGILSEVHGLVSAPKPETTAPAPKTNTTVEQLQAQLQAVTKQLQQQQAVNIVGQVAQKHDAYPDLLELVANNYGYQYNPQVGQLVTNDGTELGVALDAYLQTEPGQRLKRQQPVSRLSPSTKPAPGTVAETPTQKLHRALGLLR